MTPLCRVQPSQISRVRFPYKNSVLKYSWRYSKKSWLHRGVNDTAVICIAVSLTSMCHAQRCHWHRCPTNFINYLREFEALFEKALTGVSGTQGKLSDKKNRGRKSRVRVPLRFFFIIFSIRLGKKISLVRPMVVFFALIVFNSYFLAYPTKLVHKFSTFPTFLIVLFNRSVQLFKAKNREWSKLSASDMALFLEARTLNYKQHFVLQ
jgi:hypothetical protein